MSPIGIAGRSSALGAQTTKNNTNINVLYRSGGATRQQPGVGT